MLSQSLSIRQLHLKSIQIAFSNQYTHNLKQHIQRSQYSNHLLLSTKIDFPFTNHLNLFCPYVFFKTIRSISCELLVEYFVLKGKTRFHLYYLQNL